MLVAGAILALTSVVATGYLDIPVNPTIAPIAVALLVIAALGSFSLYPVVGIALFAFIGVLMFKQNIFRMSASKPTYGEIAIAEQPHVHAQPYKTMHVGPREYDQFNETDGHNPLLSTTEGFEPAPFDSEVGASVEGQYPIDEARATGKPDTHEYTYFPDSKTGSNEVEQEEGVGLDEKLQAIGY